MANTSLGKLRPGGRCGPLIAKLFQIIYLIYIGPKFAHAWTKVTVKRNKSLTADWLLTSHQTHNSFFEVNQLLLLLLPAVKVNLDQRLQLHQVLLHPLTMDVLKKM